MEKNVEYYLSKGFEPKMAEYYASGRKKITDVRANDDFTLTIRFDNGEIRNLDMKPDLCPSTVFAPFMEWDNFRRVYVDDSHCIAWDIDPTVDSNVVWNNKVDLCPDTCYVDSIPERVIVP